MSRAECVALAEGILATLERIGVLIDEAVARCEETAKACPPPRGGWFKP